MSNKIKEYLPAFLNLLAAVIIFFISFKIELRFSIPTKTAKYLGLLIVYLGMALVVWAAFYIKQAMGGMIQPRLNKLVKNGPYRLCRHPVYLGMTIAFAGIPTILRSWPGLIAVFLFFLPTEIYRAKLEEKALAKKFGCEWDTYTSQTGFFLPFVVKR